MSNESNYVSHSIYIGQALMAVCVAKNIAEDYARMYYATGSYTIRPTVQADVNFIADSIGTKS